MKLRLNRYTAAALLCGLLALAIVASTPNPAPAQTQFQFPTAPWGGYAPASVQCGAAYGINVNLAGDTKIPISVPTTLNGNAVVGGGYVVEKVVYSNPSVSLTTAAAGLFTGAGATGVTVVSNGALSTLTTNATNTAGSAYAPTIAAVTESFTANPLYLNVATPQGAAATMDARVFCRPLY